MTAVLLSAVGSIALLSLFFSRVFIFLFCTEFVFLLAYLLCMVLIACFSLFSRTDSHICSYSPLVIFYFPRTDFHLFSLPDMVNPSCFLAQICFSEFLIRRSFSFLVSMNLCDEHRYY